MFLARLNEWIHQKDLLSPGERILIGISGGVDSLVLLDALHRLSTEQGWEIFAAHVNHQFRGEESRGDAEFVRSFCAERNIPCEVAEIDVPRFIRETHMNPQEASRTVRYSFFHDVSRKYNIPKLVLAHHANDQAETVLMRLIRGTGIEGLAGIPLMRRENGLTIVRPFLPFYKKELVAYCEERGLHPREDSSNLKTKYHRNFLRLKVIPWLESNLGRSVQDSFVHLADIAAAENDLMHQITREKLEEIIKWNTDNKIVIKGKLFLECHLALQRRMIKLIFNYLLQKEWNLGFIHINEVCDWIRHGRTGTKLELPQRVVAWKEYDNVVFTLPQSTEAEGFSYTLKIPGRTYIKELGVWVTAEIHPSHPSYHEPGHMAIFDLDQIQGPLRIRSRQAGDRMTLFGMQGSKKVKDIFIDNKVPRRLRDSMPVLTDEENILWLPGIKRSNLAIKTVNTKQIVTIHIEEMV
jgi:tRNA(Ile)-lysidine synthase